MGVLVGSGLGEALVNSKLTSSKPSSFSKLLVIAPEDQSVSTMLSKCVGNEVSKNVVVAKDGAALSVGCDVCSEPTQKKLFFLLAIVAPRAYQESIKI